ncbi:MAG: MFS transporter [Hyphomicrobiaceae bacterium]|nr:MFS transporter [Hyphomicrobiaceae bacterium]
MTTRVPRHILPVIAIAQLAGTSVWFAGNAVVPDLVRRGGLPPEALGDIVTAVQLGFISGTLVFAFLAIADQFSPRRIFLLCSLLAAATTAATYLTGPDLWPLLVLRFATGFCLAGIYPVGMKIAAGWYDRDLGRALGFLVGALVIGTALPHGIRALGQDLPWDAVMLAVSAIAALGGVAMYVLVPDGPHLKAGARFDPGAFAAIFRSADFRASSFGYFGHMWELYAFWAFVPAYIAAHAGSAGAGQATLSLLAFVIIAAGAIGCMVGGLASQSFGSAHVARVQLGVSGLCCLLSPLAFLLPLPATIAFLLVWGITVVGDSPQFSAMNARTAPPLLVGSALTIANSIGFAISIASIQLLNVLNGDISMQFLFWILLPGPIFGLMALRRLALR